jgi:methyl-accepting chemotaxis protein
MLTWFRNCKTSTKLILAFTLGGTIGMGIGLLNIYQVKKQDSFVRALYEDRLIPAVTLSLINDNVIIIRSRALEMVAGLYPKDLAVLYERANTSGKEVESLIQKYTATPLLEEEPRLFEEFKKAWKDFNAARDNTMKLALSGNLGKARESIKGDMEEKYRLVDEKIKTLLDIQNKGGNELFNKSRNTLAVTTKTTVAVVVLAMVLGLAGGLIISSIIATPLKEMTRCAQKIAAGDLDVKIGVNSQDEVGVLAQAFREMVAGLRGMITEIKTGGDHISSSSAQIASTSEQAARNNESAAAAVEETTASMHEMSVNIQNVAKNTQSQATFVKTTSTSIEEMTAAMHRIAFTAQTLVELSFQTKSAVTLGLEAVNQSIKGTDDISRSIIGSAEAVSALGSKAEEIDKIVDVIDDIADQTNLLALNAAIEAARAGEQGLGFAVVAEEVRKLAERSAKSTREIADLITGVQKGVKEAIRLMEKSIEAVEKGVGLSRQVDSSLRHIQDSVVEVDRYAKEIGGATKEQSGGSERIEKASGQLQELTQEIIAATQEQSAATEVIVKTMEKLRAMIHENASGTVELAASAEELRTQAERFQHLVDRFVLESTA